MLNKDVDMICDNQAIECLIEYQVPQELWELVVSIKRSLYACGDISGLMFSDLSRYVSLKQETECGDMFYSSLLREAAASLGQ